MRFWKRSDFEDAAQEPRDDFRWAEFEEENFPALRLAHVARIVRRIGKWMLNLLIIMALAMLFAPWQQSIRGDGAVIALDPGERPQAVLAPIKGRIAERGEGVTENAYVKQGQLLFMIEDQDPMYLSRLTDTVGFARTEVEVAKERLKRAHDFRVKSEDIVEYTSDELESMRSARDQLVSAYNFFVDQAENKLAAEKSKLLSWEAKLWQAEADFKRKELAFEEGLDSELNAQVTKQKYLDAEAYVEVAKQEVENARNGLEGKKRERESKREEWEAKVNKVRAQLEKARADVDKAKIDIDKTTEEINQKKIKLQEQERKLASQQTQNVTAPCDGYIMDLAVFETSSIVKPGDQLCRIVPRTENPAVQVWVSGNDAPLIAPGRHVRLQFEGWPAVQFSGWPSVAVGTFGGEVWLVDPTDNGNGQFRVVVVPDPDDAPWPEYPYLRQGARAHAWVLLNQVPLGYEVWRQMNGFPPSVKSQDDVKTPKPPKIKID